MSFCIQSVAGTIFCNSVWDYSWFYWVLWGTVL